MLVGTSIGGYTLVRLLGAGGMGSVYLANDPAIGQQVAVKVIRTDLGAYADSSSAEAALERFRQEARAVARLDHLHILPLYRYGEEDTAQGLQAYMIMQYRPEGSLWDWLRRRADLAAGRASVPLTEFSTSLSSSWPLGIEEAAEYVQQAASALQYAHDQGIVHRDIKPANFLLRVASQDKVAHLLLSDFGLAKVFTASSATNTILGTPTYMAPEQFEGVARPESDQYALAVMAYYLLAGRAPFEGDALRLMRQHLSADVPSIVAFNPTLPPSLNSVLGQALAKSPERRFPSIMAFAEAFTRLAKPLQSGFVNPSSEPGFGTSDYSAATTMSPSPQFLKPGPSNQSANRQGPGPLFLPGVANSNQGAYVNALSPAPTAYPSPRPASTPAPGLYNMPASVPPTTPFPVAEPSPHPDLPGYRSEGLTVRPVSSPTPANLAPPSGPPRVPNYPGQSQARDLSGGSQVSRRSALGWIVGGVIAAAAVGGVGAYVFLNNRLPANIQSILKDHTNVVTSLSWTPDGKQLASGSLDKTVRLWSTGNGSSPNPLNAMVEVRSLSWSSDGTMLAVGGDNRNLSLWGADGSAIKRLAPLGWGDSIRALDWYGSGNKNLLYVGTYGNGLHAVDVSDYTRYGSNDLNVFILGMAISPDAHYLAIALESGIVYLADLTAKWKDVYRFPNTYGTASSVAWSPDGSLLAVGYANNVVMVYNINTYQVAYTLKHSAAVFSVAWWNSNQGSKVLASGAADNSVNIWNLSAAQPAQTIYSGHTGAVMAVAWSNDLLASASKDKTVILWQPPSQ